MRARSLLLLILGLAGTAHAQVPGTDVYVLPIRDGGLDPAAEPTNLTARVGYDNQPAFLPGREALWFTSIDSAGQADIWRADLQSGALEAVTRNPTSEYSPTPIPGEDRFSVVRVEPDSIQRLWSFAPDGTDPRLVLEGPAGVGYHAWGEDRELILFILGSPHELHRAVAGQEGSTRVAVDIGRCLQRIPGQDAWSFPLADGNGGWTISRLERTSGAITPIAPAPVPQMQDFCWTPAGELWSSDGTRILAWREGAWAVVRDLLPEGVTGISRMAVSGDGRWFAFVADDAPGNP